jgi:hypothetical protein
MAILPIAGFLMGDVESSAADLYVAQNGQTPVPPYSSLATAATSIQDAVNAAVDEDTIWIAPGTYKASSTPVQHQGPNAVYINKLLTVKSLSRDPGDTIIDGEGVNRGIAVRVPHNSSKRFVLDGITVTGGFSSKGGGILLDSGGWGWTAELRNCIIRENVSSGHGGGVATVDVYVAPFSLVVTDCIIKGNHASSTSGLGGGIMARLVSGSLNITNSVLEGNSAHMGGALRSVGGVNTVENCRVTANHAVMIGGGLNTSGVDVYRNCLIDNNICDSSGFSKGGGGIGSVWSQFPLEITNCTIVKNAPSGVLVQSNFPTTISNSIIYFNTQTDVAVNAGAATYSNVCSTNSKPGTGNITANPGFDGEDFYLSSSSPCINAGSDAPWMVDAFDLNGYDRLNGTVDIGCHEYRVAPFIIHGGLANAEIVTAPTPPRMVTWAAQDLQEYLYKITGVELPIVTAKSPGVALQLYVGRSAETEALNLSSRGLPSGAFRIRSGADWMAFLGEDDDYVPPSVGGGSPSNLAIWDGLTGHTWAHPLHSHSRSYSSAAGVWAFDKRGSLNAVHEFLRGLGVRWYFPGDLGEVVPQAANVSLARINKVVHPDFKLRKIHFMYHEFIHNNLADLKWQARLGLNPGTELIGRSAFGHGLAYVIGREEQKLAHPEYYALFDGVRATTPYDGKPCLTSTGLFNENIGYVSASYDIYGERTMSVMPTDGYSRLCEHPGCAGLDTPARGFEGRFSDYVWKYVNDVATQLNQNYPDKRVSCLAYSTFLLPPLNITTFSPNVSVGLCQWRSNFYDPAQKAMYHGLVDEWLSRLPSKEMYIYDYYLHSRDPGSWAGVPVYFPHTISENLKFLKGKSQGEFIEVHRNYGPNNEPWHALAANHLNVYVTTRLWWDADQDVDALLDEYYTNYYGPAAAEMKAFIEFCEANWPVMRTPNGPLLIDEAMELLSAAVDAAGSGIYGDRIALVSTYVERLVEYRQNFGDRYVAQNGQTPVWPYASWETAATNIQDAVSAAQHDYTVWVGPGVYKAPSTPVAHLGSNVVYADKFLTLKSASGDPTDTIIDGDGVHRGVVVKYIGASDRRFILDGFTITNGSSSRGGGVLIDNGNHTWTAEVRNCIISNNISSGHGGGLATVDNATSQFELLVSDCIIEDNEASSTSGFGGGIRALLTNGTVSVTNSVLGGNSAYNGGGLAVTGQVLVENSRITDNYAVNVGGGIAAGGTSVYRNLLIDGNVCASVGYSKGGGGIGSLWPSGSLEVSNCTIVGNAPSGATIQSNQATSFNNSIIYFNTVADVTINAGTVTYSHVCATTLKSGTGNIATNPDLDVADFSLNNTSPCIDAGLNAPWMTGALDLDGNPRLNGTVDMGCLEFH